MQMEVPPKSKHILVPIDDKEHCVRAFDWYLENFGSDKQNIILLHVYSSLNNVKQSTTHSHSEDIADVQEADLTNLMEAAKEQAKVMLEKFEVKCKKNKISFKTRIELGSPGEAICKVAKEENVTCILLGNRGLGAFRRTILGSVSDYVVHHSRCPVIIVPPGSDHKP